VTFLGILFHTTTISSIFWHRLQFPCSFFLSTVAAT